MGEIQVSGTATVTGLVEFTGVQFLQMLIDLEYSK